MNVIGLDLSTNTGIVALSDTPTFFFADEIHAGKLTGYARLVWYRTRILKLLATYPPELVVLEGYAFAGKFTNSFQYEIGVTVRMALHDAGIPWVEVPPTSLKSVVSPAGGKAAKGHMMLSVFKRWGFDPATDNIADAYGLAKVGQEILGMETGFTKANKTTIFKVQSVKDYVASKA